MYILKDLAAVPSRFKSIEGEAGVIRVPLYFHTPIDVIKRSMLQTMSSTSEGKQDVREPHRQDAVEESHGVWNAILQSLKNTCTPP